MLNNTLLSNTHLSTMIMIFKYVIHIIKSSIFFFLDFLCTLFILTFCYLILIFQLWEQAQLNASFESFYMGESSKFVKKF